MEKGIVLDVKNNKLTIRFAKSDACAKCGGCEIKDNHAILADVTNTVDAKAGDTVVVDMSSANIVTASFIIYLVPVLGLLLGYFTGSYIANLLNLSKNIAIVSSIILFIATFPLIGYIDKKIAKNPNFKPVIIRKM